MVQIGKYIVRIFWVLLWIGIIYAFLMVPTWFKKDETVVAKSLRIYTWAHRIDESFIKQFEQKTGIKVYLNYYESSEELLTKFEMMPSIDCDIIIPSAYIIPSLIQHNIIKKIDRLQCSFFKDISPYFLGMYFDVQNDYSLPLYWDVFGIGYNNKMISVNAISLDLLFKQQSIVGKQIGMSEDARESIFLAMQYLGIPFTDHLSAQDLEQIARLLYQQKKWVGAYSDSQQGYYLASQTFPVVASDREIVCRQMLNHDYISFALIPQGSMLRTDSVVISATTKKDDMIYAFLEFLFARETLMHHAAKFCILPTNASVFADLDQKYIGVSDLYPGSESFKKLVVFQHGLTQKELNDFWIRHKAS